MSTTTQKAEAEAVAELVRQHPTVIKSVEERSVIAFPRRDGSVEIVHGRDVLARYDTKPLRRAGTATLESLESFVAHVNRHKGETSVLFATLGPESSPAPQIQAVYDYNQAGEESRDGERARYGKHRARYTFPLSREWKAWDNVADTWLGQGEFAAFLEERIGDITSKVGEGLKATCEKLFVPVLADGARILDLSRGLDIGENVRVSSHAKIESGETRLAFSSEHTDGNGNQVDVPRAFAIGIPVFDGGQPFQILVRLRYRLNGPKITWSLVPHEMDTVLVFAFEEAVREAVEGTALQMFRGSPE